MIWRWLPSPQCVAFEWQLLSYVGVVEHLFTLCVSFSPSSMTLYRHRFLQIKSSTDYIKYCAHRTWQKNDLSCCICKWFTGSALATASKTSESCQLRWLCGYFIILLIVTCNMTSDNFLCFSFTSESRCSQMSAFKLVKAEFKTLLLLCWHFVV